MKKISSLLHSSSSNAKKISASIKSNENPKDDDENPKDDDENPKDDKILRIYIPENFKTRDPKLKPNFPRPEII